ncbi:hypothetical protein LCGC14_1031540 [marine sediment metagenome]|uniref:Uncharacterized protein n=1 Tax=marine sediment metagenome TaxID=412755 RepID=A0A0F9MUE2_9ZZZZ
MSLEKQLRGVHDRADEILKHIAKARDRLASKREELAAWELGCAMGATSNLRDELMKIAQEHWYEDSSDEQG